jgi:glutamate racemase
VDRAALRARPTDAGLPDLAQRRVLLQGVLERAQLAVGLRGGQNLLLDQVGLLATEAVQLDHEPTDIAELELAQLPQVTSPSAHLGPLSQSWTHGRSIGVGLAPTAASAGLGAHRRPDLGQAARSGTITAPMAPRPQDPIGVFDSGVGGLTVLHELLVSLPGEDYQYLGDTARFPYGARTPAELRAFAAEIAEHLVQRGAKLIVIACGSASAAAIDAVEDHLRTLGHDIDVIDVLRPAAQLAVVTTHSGRIGLLATPATVSSGAYERAIAAADPHVHLESVACPDLARIIQSGFPFDQAVVDTVRRYCAPLREAMVDTVILGSTHYPLCAPILQRTLGRGVSLIASGTGVARSVERALAARDLLNPQSGEGSYGFECTGDADTFAELGTRFLQMPLGNVQSVRLHARMAA